MTFIHKHSQRFRVFNFTCMLFFFKNVATLKKPHLSTPPSQSHTLQLDEGEMTLICCVNTWAYPRTTDHSQITIVSLLVWASLLNLYSFFNCIVGNHPHLLDHVPTTALATCLPSHWTPWSSKGRTFHRWLFCFWIRRSGEDVKSMWKCQFFGHLSGQIIVTSHDLTPNGS